MTTSEYTDNIGNHRRVYRLIRHRYHVADYNSVEELAKHINLAELVEDQDPACTERLDRGVGGLLPSRNITPPRPHF